VTSLGQHHGRAASSFAGAAAAIGIAGIAMAGVVAPQPKAGAPLPDLTPAQLAQFNIGAVQFQRVFEIGEGLGPIFNKSACSSCHSTPLGGWGTITVTRFGYSDKGTFDPLDHLGGSLHQVAAIDSACAEFIPGPEIANVVVSRVTNSSMAFGLVESILDSDILANEDPFDSDADGVSGRAHIVEVVESPGVEKVGRFGWKAQVATVLTFSGDAAQNELGITNRLFPTESAPNGDLDLLAQCDQVPDPEDGPDGEGFDYIDRVTHFQRFLGVPPQTPKSGMTGEAIFTAIGCAKCHVASWSTPDDPGLEDALRNKTFRPYSDFLLHEMGLLGDGIVQGAAEPGEMRTPTLWNLRTRDPMLHDGRASGGTFEDRVAGVGGAIWWHAVLGSEAQGSGDAFFALSFEEQGQVVAFLNSLGRLEFDEDGNNIINIVDFVGFRDCYGQTGLTPDDPCALHDIDQDGDVDDDDFASFLVAYEDKDGDCNGNGVSDLTEILQGAPDRNFDGVPDDCVACVGDLDGDGSVNGADLGLMLAQWGSPGNADLNGDNVVDGSDLGLLLAAWGDC
jgi:CxxC motif-containing protein (DUF1111 family)